MEYQKKNSRRVIFYTQTTTTKNKFMRKKVQKEHESGFIF